MTPGNFYTTTRRHSDPTFLLPFFFSYPQQQKRIRRTIKKEKKKDYNSRRYKIGQSIIARRVRTAKTRDSRSAQRARIYKSGKSQPLCLRCVCVEMRMAWANGVEGEDKKTKCASEKKTFTSPAGESKKENGETITINT